MAIHLARHISEREGAHYHANGVWDGAGFEDCAWCAVGMARDIATGGAHAPTLVEMEGVRDLVMGPYNGTTSGLLLDGVKAAWGWSPRVIPYNATWATLWSAVPVGGGIALMGKLSMFPDGHRLRRWQPGYVLGHAIHGTKLDEATGWWDDPLGPKDGSYTGELATAAEMAKFYGGLRGAGADTIITPPAVAVAAQGVEMFPIVTVTPLPAPNPRLFTIKAGATVIGYDPARPGERLNERIFATDSSAHIDAIVSVEWGNLGGQPRPVPSGWPFGRVVDGVYAGNLIVLLAKLPDGSPAIVLEPDAPAAGGVSQDQLAAAVLNASTTTKDATKKQARAASDAAIAAI